MAFTHTFTGVVLCHILIGFYRECAGPKISVLVYSPHGALPIESYQEHIDTTTPQGELIFTVMASLAQFDSALVSERVKAGMARAKAQRKRISRAPIAPPLQPCLALLYAQGTAISHISTRLGIGYGTA